MIDGNTTVWTIRILFTTLSLTSGYLIWWRWVRFDRITSLLLAPLVSAIIVIIIGTPLYWLYRFDIEAIIVIIAALSIISIIASIWPLPTKQVTYLPTRSLANTLNPYNKHKLPTIVFSLLYLLIICICMFLLLQGRTIDATLGPWDRINGIFFISYGVASFLLLAIGYLQKTKTSIYLLLLIIHGICTLSVLGIIFPLGYGFDPFLHRAAETIIDQYGVVSPKTLYYIGQYVVVVFLSKLLSIPIFYIDTWLVPILAVFSVIPLTVLSIQRLISERSMTMTLAALIFIIPFTSIINTTPWSLSFLLFVVTLLLILLYIQKQLKALLVIAYCVTIASIFVHPLGGIPTLIVTGIATMIYELMPRIHRKTSKTITSIFVVATMSILVPFAFFLNSYFSKQLSIAVSPPADIPSFFENIESLIFSYVSRFNAWQDMAYFFPHIFGLLLIVIALSVTAYYWNTHRMYRKAFSTLWLCWLAIFTNFILIKGFIQFNSIITYEQGIFAQRLYDASTIVLLPFGVIVLYSLLRRLFLTSKNYPGIKIASIVIFAGIITANLYTSYPKRDAYNAYHGYTVSTSNIETVKWIEKNAGDVSHVVLASQVVAAAAIQEYGFKQYFRGKIDGQIQDIFYYPTPTSSPLYADYREMLSNPTQEKISNIMSTYDIDLFYLVVNHYEPQYEGTNNKLRSVATSEYVIHESNSEDTIFVFKKNKSY